MIRLLAGHSTKKITEEMGIKEHTFYQIKNSPLFQLELRKMMKRREELLFLIHENFLTAAHLGVKHHKDILSEATTPLNRREKQQSANLMATLAAKLIGMRALSKGNLGDIEDDEGSYEERLRRVIVEEKVTRVTPQQSEAPQEVELTTPGDDTPETPGDELAEIGAELEEEEEEALFGETDSDIEDELLTLIPPASIERTLEKAAHGSD